MTEREDETALLERLVNGLPAVEPEERPEPPPGLSVPAMTLWSRLVTEFEFSLGEFAVLEQLVECKSLLDHLTAAWEHDGKPTMASGSMGQEIIDPRIQEIRMVRGQYAALIKQLALPSESIEGGRKRPGRPTRISGQGGTWGAFQGAGS